MSEKKLQQNRGIKITELKAGEKCRVITLDTSNAKRLQILLSMGILPGRNVTILQTFPSNIFQVGQTQYAVDNNIANAIYVIPDKTEKKQLD